MSDDWRPDLDVLDRLEMPADVHDRVGKTSVPLPPDHTTAKRVVAGVVAFAVFALAGVFAWRAFRPDEHESLAGTPGEVAGTLIWPERTDAGLAAAQAQADSGDASVAWRLDPKQVATHFAEDVLGWGQPGLGSYKVSVGGPETDGSPPPDGVVVATLDRAAPPCPSRLPGAKMNCPAPYSGESLWLHQAGVTGTNGVWSIEAAYATGFEPDAEPGGTLNGNEPLKGSVAFPATADPAFGYTVQGGYFVGDGGSCSTGSVNGLSEGPYSIPLTLPKTWTPDGPCAETSGLTWLAAAQVQPCPPNTIGCPAVLLEHDADLTGASKPLFGLTAVPILISIQGSPSDSSPSATVSVPNLVGRDVATAKSILAEAGLTVDVSKVSSANPPGTIDRQSPDAGAIVAPGDTVHLDVSVGLPGSDLGALDCPSGEQSATMLDPPFKLTPTDPSETVETLVRTHFSGIQLTDQVTTSTSEAGDNVVVSRSGAVIARAFLMPHLNEWLVSEVALCASSGVDAPSH